MSARGGSRKDGPLLEGPAPKDGAEALLGRLLADDLITRDRHGNYSLRSYGRDALLALRLIDHQQTKRSRP